MPALTYYNNIPAATDQISLSQPQIQTNFGSIDSLIQVDHATFASTNAGFHNKITFPVQPSAPSFALGNIGLYSFLNPTTTVNELYITLQDGTRVPMSASSKAGVGYTYLPSGLLIQWGTALGKGNVAVGFPIAFPHSTLNIQTTCTVSSTSTDPNVVGITSNESSTGFNLYIVTRDAANTPAPFNTNIAWVAIGY
jgi:hypothetical protein